LPTRAARSFSVAFVAFVSLTAMISTGCRQDMHDQPKYIPMRESSFFADAQSARPLVAGTVARGHLNDDPLLYTGKQGDGDATMFPFPVTEQVMARGQERFNIYCSPCHGRTGLGDGMVVRRGYRRPPSMHQDRRRSAAAGAGGALLRRDDQRIRRDARLCRAGAGHGPVGDCGLYPRAAVERPRDAGGCTGRRPRTSRRGSSGTAGAAIGTRTRDDGAA
jgi:hypothetical protein